MRQRTFTALFAAAFVIAVAIVVLVGRRTEDDPPRLVPGASGPTVIDPLAYRDEARHDFEARAAEGLEHVLYAKSPGGVLATARRVERFRPIVDDVAREADLDPDILEAIVFLESAGRPDARASDDLTGAVGLTQILAETGRNLLDMRIDLEASARLTRGIARGRKVRERERLRRRVDERFDPRKSLQATARYLIFARKHLRRDDLAVVSYHMGVGNLQRALKAYGEDDIPYAQLYFDSTPLRHAEAWRVLSSLGDDSSTYLWRVYAARRIMALYRHGPEELAVRAVGHGAKNSAENVLHPPESTRIYEDPFALGRARADGDLVALDPAQLKRFGLALHPKQGELARRLRQSPRLYRALQPEARALLLYLGTGVRAIAKTEPLQITSAVRDRRYQRLLARSNPEATHAYSLHTTGWAFDISRNYRSRAQAQAFQFWLDRLQALGLIAWVREPGAIHITVARRARTLTGVASRAAP